ncbi:MAG: hypothetical protein ABR498_04525 [Candidatus Dormibacteria bacterium]
MSKRRLPFVAAVAAATAVPLFAVHAGQASGPDPGVGVVPQGTQSDSSFAASNGSVTWSVPTDQQVSCYTPEVPYSASLAPADAYTGETACGGSATTGENTGPYPTQSGSNPGYPASTPMLVKDHSESDIRVDPTNAHHLIGSSKWFVSAEGYNHLLGFYESFDGGATWPAQGHIPGYEGWTDNTDPVGAFDPWGNYYAFILPYQFFYDANGGHDYKINQNREPNPAVAAEIVSVAVRRHGASAANDWITTHNGALDVVASYDSVGNEPDKQWITTDLNASSPHYGRVYLMWVDFHSATPVPYISYADAHPDGTHTNWSTPQRLPEGGNHPQGLTYLLPHVAPDGSVWTTLTNFEPKQGYCCVNIVVDHSNDGGATWQGASPAVTDITPPGLTYNNTTFRSGIENTFTVGLTRASGASAYPLYIAYEDDSTGVTNTLLTASYDGGSTWTSPIQVNDNAAPADEFQPNLAAAPDGTISVNFYDRRLTCPASSSPDAATAGVALDTSNPNWSGSLPPYGAANYCINAAVQLYGSQLAPIGHNTRLSPHTWDPQLSSPHAYAISDPTTFIGDYFGNVPDPALRTEVATFVSTANDDGHNGAHQQQQVVASVPLP